ncbi:MAG: fluoride efflux transporter CrcB [Cyanobacteria bacterium J06633_2]
MSETTNIRTPLAIGLGAIAGGCCRYYVGQWVGQVFDIGFPIDTFVVNVSGCFLMGVVTTLIAKQLFINPDQILFITTGFLGSYTTFSTYELGVFQLFESDMEKYAVIYWLGSPLLGLLGLGMGIVLARAIASFRSLSLPD